MITVISGTNRTNSETENISEFICEMLQKEGTEEVQLLKLTDLPSDFISNDMYIKGNQSPDISDIQDKYLLPASKFWFVFPEYNGGIPGILKLFVDAISVRVRDDTFKGKKACLTGISSGRAGNLRGMDHMTNILNYLKVIVLPNRLPISSIMNLKDDTGLLSDINTIKVLNLQMQEFLEF